MQAFTREMAWDGRQVMKSDNKSTVISTKAPWRHGWGVSSIFPAFSHSYS